MTKTVLARLRNRAYLPHLIWFALTLLIVTGVVNRSYAQQGSAQTPSSDTKPQRVSDQAQTAPHQVRVYPFQLKHGVDHGASGSLPESMFVPFAAPAGSHLTYYGGPVVSNIQVVVVNYGTGSYLPELATNLPGFFTAITDGTFMDLLSEYYTVGRGGSNQQIQHGTYVGTYDITPSAANNGSTIDDTQIQAELAAQINAGHLPAPTYDGAGNANTWYIIYFPHGKTITQGGSSSCVAGGFCAYHGTATLNSRDVLYGVQPDMQAGSGCDTGCGNSATAFNNYSSVASHEFAETITDPAVGLANVLGPPLAWYDNTNGEIGDICNAQQGTADGYTVQAEFSNLQGNCVVGPVSLPVTAPANSTPGVAFNVTVTAKNSSGANTGSGYTGTIHFSSSDNTATLPGDYTFTSGDAGTHTFSATLNASGAQTINVADTLASGFRGSANVSVGAAVNDFSIGANPTSFSVQQGASGTSTISTAVTAGSAGTVSLSVSGVPSGASASLSPTSITAGASSTLTFSAGTAATGTYTLTVTGIEGSNSHNTTVSVTVTAPVTNDFSISASPTTVSVTAGGSGTSTIATAITSGNAQTVNLSISGLPSGASATFNPTSITGAGTSTLTLNSGTAAAGSYSLTVTGTGTSATHTTSVNFTINPVITSDFTISASPNSLSVAQGASGTSTVSTSVSSGSAQSIALSASGLPSGASASFSPASVTAGSSSTMTINAGTAVAGSYTVTVTGTGTSATHSTNIALTITSAGGSGITNGGFETGNLNGWTPSGASATVVTGGHSGTYAARLGSTSPTNGNSNITQTFTAPTGATGISFWYKMTCPDTVTYDWATVTLKDNTANTTATLLAKTCTSNTWTNRTGSLTAGHSYTLTLTSHDDNYGADPSYTLFDDVTITTTAPPPVGITNGGFETGSLSGWTPSGASDGVVSSGCHGGVYCARAGNTTPTSGDSSISQSFTIPAGKSQLSFWYKMTCPDTVTYDWVTVTLKNLTTGTTTTVVPKTCSTGSWVNKTAAVSAGTSYTLTLTSHDDNYPGDATFTLFDDVGLN